MIRKIIYVTFAAGLLCVSCKQFPNPFGSDRILAEAGKSVLYERDVASIYTPEMTAEDSVTVLKNYIDQWVRQQLKIQEATRMFQSDQGDVDRMVEEYRNSLLTYKVDQYYVDLRLDTLVTEQQLRDYYDRNKGDFVLDKELVKAWIVKFPASFRQANRLRDLMQSNREDDYQDFVDISLKNGFELTELNSWTDFSVLLNQLPTVRDKEYDYLLNDKKIHEFTDGDMKYYVRVLDARKPGDYAPLESMSDAIKRVILNQRREEIVRQHEDSLYRHAVTNKTINLNVK